MSRKICLLRNSAEIAALSKLHMLQASIRAGKITEPEAQELFAPHIESMPDCDHHVHLTRREARKRETMGRLSFLPGWDEWYAQECVAATGRTFYPSQLFSAGMSIGRLEMYSHG